MRIHWNPDWYGQYSIIVWSILRLTFLPWFVWSRFFRENAVLPHHWAWWAITDMIFSQTFSPASSRNKQRSGNNLRIISFSIELLKFVGHLTLSLQHVHPIIPCMTIDENCTGFLTSKRECSSWYKRIPTGSLSGTLQGKFQGSWSVTVNQHSSDRIWLITVDRQPCPWDYVENICQKRNVNATSFRKSNPTWLTYRKAERFMRPSLRCAGCHISFMVQCWTDRSRLTMSW